MEIKNQTMKKKITILYDFMKEVGGLERVIFFQASALKSSYAVRLFFSHISEKNKKIIASSLGLPADVPLQDIPSPKNEIVQLVRAFLAPSRVRIGRNSLVITHSYMTTRMAHAQKKRDNTPFIIMMHHPPNFLYSHSDHNWDNNIPRKLGKLLGVYLGPFIKKMDIDSVRAADLVIANSKYTAARVREIYGVEPAVIYPAISKSFTVMKNVEKKKFLKRKEIHRPFFLAHGRIIPDKNFHFLIDKMKQFPGRDLIFTGGVEKEYREKLENLISLHGLSGHVRILGRISHEDLLGYYNCAEAFLMPAHKEDFGLTVVEALACGCPVVAWNDGAGPSETVISGKNGFLAKPYDARDFLECMKKADSMKKNNFVISASVNRFSEKSIEKEFLRTVSAVIHKKKVL